MLFRSGTFGPPRALASAKEISMRRLALVLLILPSLCACASQRVGAVKRQVDAVVQDESQRQKVLSAIHAGDTPTQAMNKVSDGPKNEQAAPK
jgi:hypothetical protein